MKKEGIRLCEPEALLVNTNKDMTIDVTADMRTKTVQNVDSLYGQRASWSPSPRHPTPLPTLVHNTREIQPESSGDDTDDYNYERLSAFTATSNYIPQEGDVLAVKDRFTSVAAPGETLPSSTRLRQGPVWLLQPEPGLRHLRQGIAESNGGYLFKLVNSGVGWQIPAETLSLPRTRNTASGAIRAI